MSVKFKRHVTNSDGTPLVGAEWDVYEVGQSGVVQSGLSDDDGLIEVTLPDKQGSRTNVRYDIKVTYQGTVLWMRAADAGQIEALDVTDTFRPPRYTTTERDALVLTADDAGTQIYNLTVSEPQMWDGSEWLRSSGTRGASIQYQYQAAASEPDAASSGAAATSGLLTTASTGWVLDPPAAASGERVWVQEITVGHGDTITYGAVAAWAGGELDITAPVSLHNANVTISSGGAAVTLSQAYTNFRALLLGWGSVASGQDKFNQALIWRVMLDLLTPNTAASPTASTTDTIRATHLISSSLDVDVGVKDSSTLLLLRSGSYTASPLRVWGIP